MRKTRSYQSHDRVTIIADEAGSPEAPSVVLLHGGGQTRHSWSGAMDALVERGYHVINFDARGHGESDWSDEGLYSLNDRVGDLQAIVEDLSQPFALVGASLGGATAIHAVASGLKPAAIVLVDIVPTPESTASSLSCVTLPGASTQSEMLSRPLPSTIPIASEPAIRRGFAGTCA